MPTLAEKTSIYDVLVWLKGQKEPLVARKNLTRASAREVLDNIKPNLQPVFFYGSDNNSEVLLESKDIVGWFHKKHVVKVEIKRSTKWVPQIVTIGGYSVRGGHSENLYLEDLEIDDD